MKRLILAAATFVLMMPVPAQAQVEEYTLEKPHTQVVFSVNHLGFSNSHGKFLDYSGVFTFDRGKPENSRVEATVITASLFMGDEKWDQHLKGADFFDVEKFPDMTFKSTKIEVLSDNTANITGDLTLLGVTKPVTLAATFNKAEKHAFSGKHVAGFSAHAKIKRSDFGMTYGLPLVGDEVDITIEVEGIRNDPPGMEQGTP
ncbi:MAG: polyisoprenoid-binding protein [Proteobacteria bacterium]|nr:polyisoprenoid-binding protein [Pseudomonadota bacterium]